MIETKFRAWDKDNKKWIDLHSLLIDCYGKVIGYADDAYNNFQTLDSIELVWFTGLHDKNGKEIYEGDILHYESPEGCSSTGNYLILWETSEDECGFTCDRKYPDYNYMLPSVWKEMEIIGNIYSNPELLEVK